MNKNIDIKNGILFFKNNKIDIVVDKYNNVWYNSLDICNVLGYKDPKNTIKMHVEKIDKKQLVNITTIYKSKKHPNSLYLSESGLYSLLFSSTKPIGKDFKKWIIYEVVPSIRKYGKYILSKKYKDKIKKMDQLIKKLENENENIKNNIKNEKYPIGGIIYVLKTKIDGIYKIGITKNMNKRKSTYNTGIPNNIEVLFYKQIICPIKIELCVKSMLYDYRYNNKREFYECNLELIKKTINKCIKLLRDKKICNQQKGGYLLSNNIMERNPCDDVLGYYINKLIQKKKIFTNDLNFILKNN